MHYYKFNIAGWHLSTAHLTLEEEAIYFRLINFYYDTESPIPEETQPVIRRLRLANHSDTTLQILEEFFVLTDKGWIHKRCDEVLKEYRKTAKKNKLNGQKGGRPSKTKASKETQKEPSGLPVGTQTEPKDNPNYELLTTNYKPITKGNRANKFATPTQEEIGVYFLERGSNDSMNQADKFYDFYQSKNWMVGKNKMKDWKAAVRNWMRGENEKTKRLNQPTSKQAIGNAIHGSTANDW